MRILETDFLRIRYQLKQIPKKPFNILCAVIILIICNFFFLGGGGVGGGICLCSLLIPLLHVSNLLQNGNFPIFSLFLAAIFVTIATVKVESIRELNTLAIVLIN